MDKKEALALLRETPLFWSRLGFGYDPPRYHGNGERIVFNPTYSEAATHASFTEVGVQVHTCILDSGWVGVDRFDYTLCDRVLHEVFEVGGAKYFVPRIKLNVPLDWCAAYPEEVCVYEDGPRDAEAIRALVDTLQQDILGYESKLGYYNANGWQDPRPNVGGVIARQSFSSRKWLEDAGEALRRLVAHLENGPYGDRILAYHIAYGTSGETITWGCHSGKFGDYGVTNRRRFLEYGLEKYGSEAALRAAWGAYEEEIIPPPALRESSDPAVAYRDKNGQWALDYDRFFVGCNVDAMEYFGKVIKEMTDDKPVGVFYGYIMHLARCAYAGHLGGWERVLESPYIDFAAAPKSYRRSGPGEPSGEMCPVTSVNARKLWVDECDIRTHLATGDAAHSHSRGKADTESMLLRELCKNLAHGSGFWFMDLGGNWYNDAEIMRYVKALCDAMCRIAPLPHRSVARTVAIVDEESLLHTQPSRNRLVEHLWRNLCLVGAPIDLILSRDVERLDLSEVEVALLLTPSQLDRGFIERVHRAIRVDGRVITFGCCAACADIEMGDKTVDGNTDHYIKDGVDLPVLCRDYYGRATAVQLPSGDIHSASLTHGVQTLRRLLEAAGATFIAPAECCVYADNRLVSFFPRADMSFVPQLPRGARLFDLLTGEEHPADAPLCIKARGGRAFILK